MVIKRAIGCVVGLCLTSLAAGCSSEPSPGPSEEEVASKPDGMGPVASQPGDRAALSSYVSDCTLYSDVVPAYVGYADYHCASPDWDGKVFCEYSSLSSVYGPGWGTCQCWKDWCKRGRCRSYGC